MPQSKKDKKEEPGFVQRHAPALTGAALSALSAPLLYKYLRRKNFSSDPAMRAIQEASGGKYTRVLPGTARVTGDAEQHSPVKKWLDRLLYAGGGDIRYKDELRRTAAKNKGQLPHIPGAVMHDLPGEQLARGNVDLISNRAADEATSHFGNQDKWREYQIFNQFAPGAMAPSSNIRDVLSELGYQVGHKNPELRAKQYEAFRKQMAANPKAREEMLNKLQGRLKEKYGPGYLLKDIDAAATGGKFPTDKHRFSDLAEQNSPEGKTLTNLIKNPSTVMAQEKLPLEQGTWLDRQFAKIRGLPSSKEVRVHVMNGAVAPDLTVPRFSPTMFLTGRKKMRGAEDFTRDLLGKLPEELRHGTYALDVAPVTGGGYRLIESNPGYRSGLLNPQNYPLTGPLAHRQFTGQWSKPVAGIGTGMGAAALGAAGAAGMHAMQPQEEPTPGPKTAALKQKTFGTLSFRIDRPKGTVKKWDQPDGSVKSFTYPCDYGYFPRLKGEDGEALDAFVGDDEKGHLESFLKLKKDDKGRLVPDETKFIVGLTDQEREKVYRLYGTEVVNRKTYDTVEALHRDLDQFRPVRKGRYQTEKTSFEKNLRKSSPEDEELFKLLAEQSPVSIKYDDKKTPAWGGGGYRFAKPKKIYLHSQLKNIPEILAHEIGHANFDKTTIGNLAQSRVSTALYNLQLPIALGILAKLKKPMHQALGVGGAVAATSFPILLAEHQAWKDAKRQYEEGNATSKQLKLLEKAKARNLPSYYESPVKTLVLSGLIGLLAHTGKHAELNARPSVNPGTPAGKATWQLREEKMVATRREAEALRAAAVKTQSGKDIPPVSEIHTQAMKAAMAFYGVKNADIDKIMNGTVLFSDQGDASSPAHAHAAENANKADKLDRVFKSFDDRQGSGVGQGTESSVGTLSHGDVIG